MYFNQIDEKRASVLMSKLGGSKIPAESRIDIERTLRVKDAVDVLDTLEDAYYNKVKFIDGIVPPASYAAFIDAIPRYLSTSHQCDLNKQLRIMPKSKIICT